MPKLLEINSVTKDFPGVRALDGVSISLGEKKIYGLIGENGAGKSTLINILMGIYPPADGDIMKNGKKIKIKSPAQAKEYGINAVFQDFSFIPQMSVAENLFLGKEDKFYKYGLISTSDLENEGKRIIEKVGLDIDVTLPSYALSPSERKLVEFAKVLASRAEIIILDEITAPLESSEVANLFKIIQSEKEKGRTFIFITHRMGEVLKISDECIVLRDGKLAGTISTEKAKRRDIIRMMIGEAKGMVFPKKKIKRKGKTYFKLRKIETERILGISTDIRQGEIVALAGLRGQGQSELLRAIFGIIPKKGDIYMDGKKMEINSPKDALKNGIVYISDRRDLEELCLNQSVLKNITMRTLKERSRFGFIKRQEEKKVCKTVISKLDIETTSPNKDVLYLSGGNRQRTVIAKSLLRPPKILLADQPTIGLDVGAKEHIYRILRDLSNRGISILTVLTEMEEVVNFPDRVLVMGGGRYARSSLDGK